MTKNTYIISTSNLENIQQFNYLFLLISAAMYCFWFLFSREGRNVHLVPWKKKFCKCIISDIKKPSWHYTVRKSEKNGRNPGTQKRYKRGENKWIYQSLDVFPRKKQSWSCAHIASENSPVSQKQRWRLSIVLIISRCFQLIHQR